MKTKSFCTFAVAGLLALAAVSPALAETAEQSSRYGAEIRKAQVSGYTLVYKLIDIPAMNASSVMTRTTHEPAPLKSHHLMVFVTGPDGRPAAEGKGGFLVVRPNKTESKDIAVSMDGGFGTDVDLPFKGDYAITAKLVLHGADLVDTFVHEVK